MPPPSISDHPIVTVATPTLVGLCVGSALFLATLAAVSCVCYRRRQGTWGTVNSGKWGTTLSPNTLKPKKKTPTSSPNEPALPLRKATTAVRSPSSGPAGPVLKKTPSPTSGGPQVMGHVIRSPNSPSDCQSNVIDEVTVESAHKNRTPTQENKPQKPSVKCYLENEGIRITTSQNKELYDIENREKEVTEEKVKNEKRKNNETGKLGQLHFRLKYSSEKHALLVTIVRCSDLPAKDINVGTSDPYVKLQLLPEKQHKVKTRVLRKTLNPVYDEDFTFYGLNPNQLRATTLHFVVLSFDRYSRDDVIGEVVCSMSSGDCDGLEGQQITLEKEITPRNLKIRSQGRGELLVSLCHQPAANRLTVVVLKARNLPKMDVTGLCDPYVKMYLLYNNQRIAKKKTHVKKRTINPVFNESFVFDVPYNEGLGNLSLEFLVLDWDRVTKNEVIGRLELGPKAGGGTQQHWLEVCGAPRRQIAEWHKLRD